MADLPGGQLFQGVRCREAEVRRGQEEGAAALKREGRRARHKRAVGALTLK